MIFSDNLEFCETFGYSIIKKKLKDHGGWKQTYRGLMKNDTVYRLYFKHEYLIQFTKLRLKLSLLKKCTLCTLKVTCRGRMMIDEAIVTLLRQYWQDIKASSTRILLLHIQCVCYLACSRAQWSEGVTKPPWSSEQI